MADTEKRPSPIIVGLGVAFTVAFGALWIFIVVMFLNDAFPKDPPSLALSEAEAALVFIVPLLGVGVGVFFLVSYIRDPGGFLRGGGGYDSFG
jgi:hypothetical protein